METVRHEFERGWLELASREPRTALRPHVGTYWGYDERTAAPMRRREVAQSDVVLILSWGPELRQWSPLDPCRTVRRNRAFVAGLHEASVITEHDGVSYGIEVNLTPLAAHMIFGVPMHELANRVVEVEELLGPAARELLERLHNAPGWSSRFDVLDAALEARVSDSVRPQPSVAWAWRRLVETEGRIPVRALADELGCSRKHLATGFREEVGLPPKTLARILRFRRATRLLGNGARLAEVALDCGYYDQAHFNRDFHQFAGSTPREFLARRYRDGAGVAPA